MLLLILLILFVPLIIFIVHTGDESSELKGMSNPILFDHIKDEYVDK